MNDFGRKYSTYSYRENVEWTNYWFSDMNVDSEKKYCLIGDSLSREVRSTLESITHVPVDYLGTSSLMLDRKFFIELETFFKISEAHYDFVHIQIGDHGITDIEKSLLNDAFYCDYTNALEEVIDYLKTQSNKIVIASITEIVEVPKINNSIIRKLYNAFHISKNEKIDKRYEEDIIRRNELSKKVAKDKNCEFNDLYHFMKTEGEKYKHKDHIHYENKCKPFLANRIASFI